MWSTLWNIHSFKVSSPDVCIVLDMWYYQSYRMSISLAKNEKREPSKMWMNENDEWRYTKLNSVCRIKKNLFPSIFHLSLSLLVLAVANWRINCTLFSSYPYPFMDMTRVQCALIAYLPWTRGRGLTWKFYLALTCLSPPFLPIQCTDILYAVRLHFVTDFRSSISVHHWNSMQ